MSVQPTSTEDDKETGEKCAIKSSGTETAKAETKEVLEPSTAVIQMTIQPQTQTQTEASTESHTMTTEPIDIVLAELPQALLDIVPMEVATVQPAVGTSAFEYVAELEEPLVPVPVPEFGAPRPAFSYRSDAALMHQYPAAAAAAAAAARTYDYTDEGEFTLEQALADIVEASPSLPGPPAAPPSLAWPPALDPATLYQELERGFDLDTFEDGFELPAGSPVEFCDNSATLQSELFELGQGGFCAGAGSEEVEALEARAVASAPASEPDLPLPDLPEDLLSPNDQPGPSRTIAHAVQLYPGGGEGEPHTCYITNLPRLAIEETFFEEGEAVESGGGEATPLQTSPLPSTSRADHMLRQLLAASPPDEEGEGPSPRAPQNTAEEGSEPDTENKPDAIAVTLSSAAVSIASIATNDSQTIENAAAREIHEEIPQAVVQAEVAVSTRPEDEKLIAGSENCNAANADAPTGNKETGPLSEAMEHLPVSVPLDTALETEASVPVALVQDADLQETDHTSERPTVTASDGTVPGAVDIIPEEQGADTDAVATLDTVDSTASTASKPLPIKKRKVPAAAAASAPIKSKKPKKVVSDIKKKPVASGSTAAAAVVPAKQKLKKFTSVQSRSLKQAASSKTAFPVKAKTVRKATKQEQPTSESTVSSEDSNDSKTLAAIIAERNAATVAAVKKPPTAAVAGDDIVSGAKTTAAAEDTTASAAGAAAVARAAAAAAAATSALAAPATIPTQQSASSQKAKGKRAASGQYAKPSKNRAKKARPAEVPTTTMVLRSRSHLI